MKVILDALGGDNAPIEIIQGARLALQASDDIEIILLGDENKLKEILKRENINDKRITTYHCEDEILGTDDPIWAVKNKKNSTIVKGLNYYKNSDADVFISAGNTGALFTAANLIIKRINGAKRSGLGIIFPSEKGPKLMLDCGANLTLSPEYYNQLAIMGSVYFEEVTNSQSPKVGLINIGTEEHKGIESIVEAYKLLKENKKINFCGNCEARDILKGDFDVMICDGFTGNIVLKTLEGTAKYLTNGLKEIFKSNYVTMLSALMIKGKFKDFKARLDYKEHGAAPIIGLRKPVMKAHGSSDRKAIKNAILNSRKYAQSNIIEKIEAQLSDFNFKQN